MCSKDLENPTYGLLKKPGHYTRFYIIVNEARDKSMNEHMTIALKFIDKNGFVQKRFFRLIHVSDTVALTL
jgi:chlorite dismutase